MLLRSVQMCIRDRILSEEVISYLRFEEIHVGSVIRIYGSNVAPVGIDLVSVNPLQVFVTDYNILYKDVVVLLCAALNHFDQLATADDTLLLPV